MRFYEEKKAISSKKLPKKYLRKGLDILKSMEFFVQENPIDLKFLNLSKLSFYLPKLSLKGINTKTQFPTNSPTKTPLIALIKPQKK